MRGHDQTNGRSRRRAWFWLILSVACGAAQAPAQEAMQGEPPPLTADPIELAAEEIRYWDSGGSRWAILSGKAAVIQGLEGLRADSVALKVDTISAATERFYRAEVYAEGNVQAIGEAGAKRSYRIQLTARDLRLKPYKSNGAVFLKNPPRELAILVRGFPSRTWSAAPRPVATAFATQSTPPASKMPGRNNAPMRDSAVVQTQARPEDLAQLPPPVPPSASIPAAERPAQAARVPAPAAPIDLPPPLPNQSAPVRRPSAVDAARPSATADSRSNTASAGTPVQEAVGRTPSVRPRQAPAANERSSAPFPKDQPAQRLPQPAVADAPPPAVEAVASSPRREATSNAPPAAVEAADRAPTPSVPPPPPRGLRTTAFQQAESGPENVPGGGLVNPPPDAPVVDLPPIEGAPEGPQPMEGPDVPGPNLVPLPGPDGQPAPPRTPERRPAPPPTAPILPGSQRVWRFMPRNGGPDFQYRTLNITPDGIQPIIVRGGVTVVVNMPPPRGTIDLSADSAIIWRHVEAGRKGERAPDGSYVEDARAPLEVYLEGHIVARMDSREKAGPADQKVIQATQLFYDLRTDRMVMNDAEVDLFAPTLIAPLKIKAPRIEQFRPIVPGVNGTFAYGFEQLRADDSVMTGSRFPNPGYRIKNRKLDLVKKVDPKADPNTGGSPGNPRDPRDQETTWHYDARGNRFMMGPVPIFYWPRIRGDAEDFEPVLRNILYGQVNYLGQTLYTDWNGFRALGIERPKWIDTWNIDVDYLSARTKHFPALGTEMGWFGKDFGNDIIDPYRRDRGLPPSGLYDYMGYIDLWGLQDSGVDDLGSGPAIVTNKLFLPDGTLAGKAGFQRGPNSVGHGIPSLGVPPFQEFRGRATIRHMQYLIPDTEDTRFEDFRVQTELGYYSDRYFLEEYFKRLFDTGLDEETLAYLIRQRGNSGWSLWTEGNMMPWQTETQWLPRLDYYRFGDALANVFTYSQHSGVDYANVQTANEVNNKNIFAFIPYDPISNTSGTWSSGRAFSNHELDLPLQFDFIRVVPYVQGQVTGWTDQIDGQSVGRIWGAAGVRADVTAWKRYPYVQSELLNVHGLNHKVNFEVDYRDAYSNVNLNQIGIQDDLDDNSYESTRRYFALTNYIGGVLPGQYDPRFLLLRRALSPIGGPNDIQASLSTLQMNIHQRLQTKRGPEGRRRTIDYMTLDLSTTYFPQAARDDFGKPFGQNMYNWWWFVGDRTAFYSYGWFEFWNIGGVPTYKTNVARHNDPFGLNVITSGISITRPPRANINLGYTVIDTGPINTSALNVSINYWLSPKWYGTFATMYDFGNGILLSQSFSLTRVGADWLTSVGLSVDPQRQAFQWAIQFAPRISPSVRLGSGAGTSSLDSRYAPTQ